MTEFRIGESKVYLSPVMDLFDRSILAHSWRNLLAGAGAKQSVSRKGTCLDNTVTEGFFGHLREELFHHARHPSVEAITAELDDYMHWYNNVRTHTRLEGLSPVEYRTQALAA